MAEQGKPEPKALAGAKPLGFVVVRNTQGLVPASGLASLVASANAINATNSAKVTSATNRANATNAPPTGRRMPPVALRKQVGEVVLALQTVLSAKPVTSATLALAERVVDAAYAAQGTSFEALLVGVFELAPAVLKVRRDDGTLRPMSAAEAYDKILELMRNGAHDLPLGFRQPSPAQRADAIRVLRALRKPDRWWIAGPRERTGGRKALVSAQHAARRLAEALGYRLARNAHDARRSPARAAARGRAVVATSSRRKKK